MALTDFKVSVIDKKLGGRVLIEVVDDTMREYLTHNERYVYSTKTGNPIRVKPDKPISSDLLSDVVILLQRCEDEIRRIRDEETRGPGQLASQKQIDRVVQLSGIMDKRKDSIFISDRRPEKMTWTQAGRLISDLKTILIKDGMWDDKNKCEIEKE